MAVSRTKDHECFLVRVRFELFGRCSKVIDVVCQVCSAANCGHVKEPPRPAKETCFFSRPRERQSICIRAPERLLELQPEGDRLDLSA